MAGKGPLKLIVSKIEIKDREGRFSENAFQNTFCKVLQATFKIYL